MHQEIFLRDQLLRTKLRMPSISYYLISRPRLLDRLSEGLKRKLTLISAAPGSGKTALVCSWLLASNQSELPFAWFSLDESDNDPMCFLRYMWEALQQLPIELDSKASDAFSHEPLPPFQSLLMHLINIFAAIETPFVLVLDDYHLIRTPAIHQALAFLLDHQPESMHLLITSREDPSLPLARLRVHNQLVEIRDADLRFSHLEVALFLTEVMGLHLEADQAALLEERTEGWAAGIQLGALALHGSTPVKTSQLLSAFTGNHRYIIDYLGEEIFQHQPKQIQTFLLQTSILDQLNSSLCDAVTNVTNSQELLKQLEQNNLFLIPLDEERHWYRYHHLFAEFLRYRWREAERQNTLQDSLKILHERASAWYAQHHLLASAVHHAFAGQAFDQAASLCEQIMQATLARGELLTLLNWFARIPEVVLLRHPRLYIRYVLALFVSGQIEDIKVSLEKAEQCLLEHGETLSSEERSQFTAQQILMQSYFAILRGDVANTRALCQQGRDLLPIEHWLYGSIPTLLGMVSWFEGNFAQAKRILTEASEINRHASNHYLFSTARYFLAQAQAMQGNLQEAIDTYLGTYDVNMYYNVDPEEPLLMYNMPKLLTPKHMIGYSLLTQEEGLLISLAALCYERNELHEAEKYIQQSMVLENNAFVIHVINGKVILARIKQAQGNKEQAYSLMQQATQLAKQHAIFWTAIVPSVAAAEAHLALEQGNFEVAGRWVEVHQYSDESADPSSYPQAVDNIIFARVFIAQGKYTEALKWLSRLYAAAMKAEHMRLALEILILQALGEQALNDIPRAFSTIETALQLAEPERYIRLFLDEGEPMAMLLKRLCTQRRNDTYFARTLLAAFSQNPLSPLCEQRKELQALTEPLSARELEVLRLVATGANNQEIAHALIIAESTVKRHLYNVFGKLGVSSRTQAIAKAHALELL